MANGPTTAAILWLARGLGLIANGCLTDWDRGATAAVQPDNGVVGQSAIDARIHDTPGQDHPYWFQYSLTQEFRDAAVCVDENSSEFGEVYGQFKFSETVQRLGARESRRA